MNQSHAFAAHPSTSSLKSNTRSAAQWLGISALALALSACGGGGGGADAGGGSPAPSPTPTPAPAPAPISLTPVADIFARADRIEPLDSAFTRALQDDSTRPASRLPLGMPVAHVLLAGQPALPPAADSGLRKRQRTGVGRSVPATSAGFAALAQQLNFVRLDDGSQVAAVGFTAEGARGLRLGLLVRQLPTGAVLRVYSPGGPVHEISAADVLAQQAQQRQAGALGDAALTIWAPATAGDTSLLEVQLPAGARATDLQLAVPLLSHLLKHMDDLQHEAIEQRRLRDIGHAGACTLDAMCRPDLDAERRATVKLEITDDRGDTGVCTGTLLNDSRGSRTPYVLTAEHCVDTAVAASSVTSYWFFYASACGQQRPSSRMLQVGGGARLLKADLLRDSSLLRLNRAAPAGVVYAGSYFGNYPLTGQNSLGVHHAEGDLTRYSLGRIEDYSFCTINDVCSPIIASRANRLRVRWQQGVTEGGSSGSALYVQSGRTRYVVGNLSGGLASCDNPNGSDYYGRFDRFFHGGASAWLKP